MLEQATKSSYTWNYARSIEVIDYQFCNQLYVPVSEEESFVVLQPTLQRKGKAKCQRCIFQKGKHVGVTTNIYLRKMLEKKNKKQASKEKGGKKENKLSS